MPCEKTLGKGGYENNWDFLSSQNFVNRVEPGAAIRKLDVGQNKAWAAFERRAHGLSVGPSDGRDIVAQLFDERLYVEGDERLILDNQDRRTNLFGNFASSALNKISHLIL